MIVLKQYQQRVLDSLDEFYRLCAAGTPIAEAFSTTQGNFNQKPSTYVSAMVHGLPSGLPYVCLRVPTGGGKTLLACYTTGLAMRDLLNRERTVVVWLVPSKAILEQTAAALRDKRHPYCRALELSCGKVEVVTIEEALQLSRARLHGATVVIVSTIQAFRVEDTTGRRVYEPNGSLLEHFQNVPPQELAGLSVGQDGKPAPSLMNVLCLRRPVVIVDEAHNARTDLSFSTLGAMRPACIIEFTATPDHTKHPSNVLHRVSPWELREENMIKLPLVVHTRVPSQRAELLSEALYLRDGLEQVATKEGQETSEYIRPILLIQAESVESCVPLRERLDTDYHVPKEQVRISTGKLEELGDIPDILSPKCPVRVVITVQRLHEGWDCPFAYVLCSLKDTHSATAIEQIVGRILRLPHAERKRHPELNRSYAFSVSASLPDVLNELRDALENNGFTQSEAMQSITLEPGPVVAAPLGFQTQTVSMAATALDMEKVNAHALALKDKVAIDLFSGTITLRSPLSSTETEKLTECLRTPEARAEVQAAIARSTEKILTAMATDRLPTAYEQKLPFRVPLLALRENQTLFDFDGTFLLERPWRLSDKDASLPASYNPLVRPESTAGVIDLTATGDVETKEIRDRPNGSAAEVVRQEALEMQGAETWTKEALIAWLDRNLDHRDISISESGPFLLKVIQGLISKFGLEDVAPLVLDRIRLRDMIAARIQEHRDAERNAAFQQYLQPDSALTVSDEHSVDFSKIEYAPSWPYEGSYQFQKHYFGPHPGELNGRTKSGAPTEEFRCAHFIDTLDAIKYWVRNIPNRSSSFWLQTSKDRFYPDFLCKLKDGRVLVVEYKGPHLIGAPDAQEKNTIGTLWAERSGGKCLFVMPSGKDFQPIVDKVR